MSIRNRDRASTTQNSLRARARAIVALLVLGLSACGSPDNTQACNEIRQVITEVSQKTVQQITTPVAMERTYRDGAATIRQKGENADGAVQGAADRVAAELGKLGDGIAELAGNTSTTPQLPDLAALTAAGQELQQACS